MMSLINLYPTPILLLVYKTGLVRNKINLLGFFLSYICGKSRQNHENQVQILERKLNSKLIKTNASVTADT